MGNDKENNEKELDNQQLKDVTGGLSLFGPYDDSMIINEEDSTESCQYNKDQGYEEDGSWKF